MYSVYAPSTPYYQAYLFFRLIYYHTYTKISQLNTEYGAHTKARVGSGLD